MPAPRMLAAQHAASWHSLLTCQQCITACLPAASDPSLSQWLPAGGCPSHGATSATSSRARSGKAAFRCCSPPQCAATPCSGGEKTSLTAWAGAWHQLPAAGHVRGARQNGMLPTTCACRLPPRLLAHTPLGRTQWAATPRALTRVVQTQWAATPTAASCWAPGRPTDVQG